MLKQPHFALTKANYLPKCGSFFRYFFKLADLLSQRGSSSFF